MNRLAAFQQVGFLTMKNKAYRDFVFSFFDRKLNEEGRDITADAILKRNSQSVRADIVVHQAGILAGVEELIAYLKSKKIKALWNFRDGREIKKGQVVGVLIGRSQPLLLVERTLLDVLGRLSGIATLTRKLSGEAAPVKIAATRKTLWGIVDKKAVAVGGGLTHRLNLESGILIKDNHLQALKEKEPIALALGRAFAYAKRHSVPFVEIEVESEKELRGVPLGHVPKGTGLLLDNFSPEEIKRTLKEIAKFRKRIVVEASGGINETNLREYARTGVDLISLGMLTHSVRSLDISLRFHGR